MSYSSLEACLEDLEKNGQLLRIKEEVDPYLEMASIHLRVFEKQGPALLFEKVKGSRYRACSNLFGTKQRCHFIFRESLPLVQELIRLRKDPLKGLKKPLKLMKLSFNALHSLPKKNPVSKPILYEEITINELPQIHHWEKDGGAFITLPQVYSENLKNPGIKHANLGMYRIQLSGNDYVQNKEIGLHYQIHRGIGIHQKIANELNKPLKISIFVGGPPSHTIAAVMPLPEDMCELNFAGLLAGRRFNYFYKDEYCISADADFVITAELHPGDNKPEGPFGDHLGYYSLQHLFPYLRVHKVYAKKEAIWPFTVVGRPPQEDSYFGELIHFITGDALQQEIPGLKQVNAVDAAGVHPLLLAVGSERYTPYQKEKKPMELLTIANRILGTGQLSLAKYLFITADEEQKVNAQQISSYFDYILRRIDLKRDIHFQTNTSIDTLDYSGNGLNSGSKVIFAAYGDLIRELSDEIPEFIKDVSLINKATLIMQGILAVEISSFTDYQTAAAQMQDLAKILLPHKNELSGFPLIIICDDASFLSTSLNNFLWVCFTRSNPASDIYGIDPFTENKHWGTYGSLFIDARIKSHHAPALLKNKEVENRVDQILKPYGF